MKRSEKRTRHLSKEDLPSLPRASEAERVVIGAVLADGLSNQHVLSKLSPDLFFNKQLGCVFSRLCAMREQDKPLDLPTLVDELESHRELETAGGAAQVASYVDGVPRRLALDSYVADIRDKAAQRRMAEIGEEIRDMALKSASPRDTLIAAEKKLSELRATLRSQKIGKVADSASEILDKIAMVLRRFVAMSPAQISIVALWVFHTHALESENVTGYLSITSAEKRCGKTRLLEVLELLVLEPWLTGRVTAAVLVRKIAAIQPTLLLDESDTALRDNSEYSDTLRGVLNLGYRSGGKTSCCVGEKGNLTFQDFSVFCAKAIAGIGSLPDTVADRSFPIRLQRRAPNERVERFERSELDKEMAVLRERVAGCAASVLPALIASKPEAIEGLGDRENEIARSLLRIAEVAGGDWPERARRALLEVFTGLLSVRDESLGVRLLDDIRRAFDQNEWQRIGSATLVQVLIADELAPWSEVERGKPLNERGLARRLGKYGIKPDHFREGPKTFRGYGRASFCDAWSRYLASAPDSSGTTGTSGTDKVLYGLPGQDENRSQGVSGTDEQSGLRILSKTKGVPGVPVVPHPGIGQANGQESGRESPEGPKPNDEA